MIITIETWMDSGANHQSSYRSSFEIESDEWDAMTDDEKDEYAKEVAWGRVDWGWKDVRRPAMSNLIRLPPTTTMTAHQALDSALVDAESKHLTDVLICGYDADGDLYIRSSRLTCAEAYFLASKAALWAQNGGQHD